MNFFNPGFNPTSKKSQLQIFFLENSDNFQPAYFSGWIRKNVCWASLDISQVRYVLDHKDSLDHFIYNFLCASMFFVVTDCNVGSTQNESLLKVGFFERE